MLQRHSMPLKRSQCIARHWKRKDNEKRDTKWQVQTHVYQYKTSKAQEHCTRRHRKSLTLLKSSGRRILCALSHTEPDFDVQTTCILASYVWRPKPVVYGCCRYITHRVDPWYVPIVVCITRFTPLTKNMQQEWATTNTWQDMMMINDTMNTWKEWFRTFDKSD